MEAVQHVDRVEIDWDRHQFPVNLRSYAVFVGTPEGEFREIVENVSRIRVKDVGTVFVDQQSRLIVMIVGIPPDVGPPIYDHYFLPEVSGHALGYHSAREPGSNN
jgi:hypothetical protein